MEDKLWRIFNNVNHWLDHGERKSSILLTFIGIQLTIGILPIEGPNRNLRDAHKNISSFEVAQISISNGNPPLSGSIRSA